MRNTDWLGKLLVFSIVIIPVLNFEEVKGLFSDSILSQSTSLTPIYIKLLKDFSYFSVFIFGMLSLFQKKITLIRLPVFFFCCCVTFFISTFATVFSIGIIPALLGVRWFFPVLLFPIFFTCITYAHQVLIKNTLTAVFFIGFFLQCAQFFAGVRYFGTYGGGYSSRSPGFYFMPASMASFTCVVFLYQISYGHKSYFRSIVLYGFCPISLLLSASGSGIIAFSVFLFFRLNAKLRFTLPSRFFLASICLFPSYFLLPFVTGRPRVYESFLERLDKFYANISIGNVFFSFNTARGTNVGVLINKILGINEQFESIVADSTVISLIQGVGVFGCVFFFMLYFRYMDLAKLRWQVFISATGPFLLTTVGFEMYPFGFLLMINLAFLIRNEALPTNRSGVAGKVAFEFQ